MSTSGRCFLAWFLFFFFFEAELRNFSRQLSVCKSNPVINNLNPGIYKYAIWSKRQVRCLKILTENKGFLTFFFFFFWQIIAGCIDCVWNWIPPDPTELGLVRLLNGTLFKGTDPQSCNSKHKTPWTFWNKFVKICFTWANISQFHSQKVGRGNWKVGY